MKFAFERYGVFLVDKLSTLPYKCVGPCLSVSHAPLIRINGCWIHVVPTLPKKEQTGPRHRINQATTSHGIRPNGLKMSRSSSQLFGYPTSRGFSTPLQQQRRNLSVSTLALSDVTGSQVSDITSKILPVVDTVGGVGVGVVDTTPVLTGDTIQSSSADSALELVSNILTEPTLASLGLCAHTPVGFIQSMLETLHVTCGLPWWGAITVFTIAVRTLLLPVVVYGQKNAAHLSNFMPELQKRQQKFQHARQSGNSHDVMLASSELQAFMRDNNVNPMKNFMLPLIQAPIFISFFLALRRMSEVPVDSLTTGGCLWFTDLTLADPFFALPLITSSTLLLCLELGAETGVENSSTKNMKNILRIMPFIILPVTYKFPAVIFTYWAVSNFYTLFQVGLLRIPFIRERAGIPKRKVHKPEDMPPSKGFFKGIREGWDDAQKSYEVSHRHDRHARALKDAALGPVPKTFSHDPTNPHRPSGRVDDTKTYKAIPGNLPPPMNPFSKKPIN